MSLINDALKKAQRQRTEGNPSPADNTTPSTTPEQLHRVARREKPAGFRSQLMLIGGGAIAAVVLLGIGAMFFFRSDDQPGATPPPPAQVADTAKPATPPPAAQPTPAPTTVVVTPALPPASVPTPTVVASTPAPQLATATPTAPAATQFSLPPASSPEVGPAAENTPSIAVPTPSVRPKPSTRMIGVIEHFRVGGIRVSGAESKVLMNDKVYRINDIVDHELGIRLTGIEIKALTFEDTRGAVHIRTF